MRTDPTNTQEKLCVNSADEDSKSRTPHIQMLTQSQGEKITAQILSISQNPLSLRQTCQFQTEKQEERQ